MYNEDEHNEYLDNNTRICATIDNKHFCDTKRFLNTIFCYCKKKLFKMENVS